MPAFKIVHRRSADRTLHCFALIKHREINDHPIKIVAQYFTSPEKVCICVEVWKESYNFYKSIVILEKFMFLLPHFHTFGKMERRHRPMSPNTQSPIYSCL